MSFEYNGSTIETDENGYLISLDDWSEGVADKLAEDEEIQMNNEHWEIINFLSRLTSFLDYLSFFGQVQK